MIIFVVFTFSLFLTSLVTKPEIPATSAPDKPALSEEEMERKSKSIIDEFLHINDFKVNEIFKKESNNNTESPVARDRGTWFWSKSVIVN